MAEWAGDSADGRGDVASVVAKIRAQLEFLFSDANLAKDRYLRRQLAASGGEECVPFAVLARFYRIAALSQNAAIIQRAAQTSSALRLSDDGTKVGRATPYVPQPPDAADAATIYVDNLPLHSHHDWLRQHFAAYGRVAHVSMPRFRSTRHRFKGFAFVEYESVAGAETAVAAYAQAAASAAAAAGAPDTGTGAAAASAPPYAAPAAAGPRSAAAAAAFDDEAAAGAGAGAGIGRGASGGEASSSVAHDAWGRDEPDTMEATATATAAAAAAQDVVDAVEDVPDPHEALADDPRFADSEDESSSDADDDDERFAPDTTAAAAGSETGSRGNKRRRRESADAGGSVDRGSWERSSLLDAPSSAAAASRPALMRVMLKRTWMQLKEAALAARRAHTQVRNLAPALPLPSADVVSRSSAAGVTYTPGVLVRLSDVPADISFRRLRDICQAPGSRVAHVDCPEVFNNGVRDKQAAFFTSSHRRRAVASASDVACRAAPASAAIASSMLVTAIVRYMTPSEAAAAVTFFSEQLTLVRSRAINAELLTGSDEIDYWRLIRDRQEAYKQSKASGASMNGDARPAAGDGLGSTAAGGGAASAHGQGGSGGLGSGLQSPATTARSGETRDTSSSGSRDSRSRSEEAHSRKRPRDTMEQFVFDGRQTRESPSYDLEDATANKRSRLQEDDAQEESGK